MDQQDASPLADAEAILLARVYSFILSWDAEPSVDSALQGESPNTKEHKSALNSALPPDTEDIGTGARIADQMGSTVRGDT